MLKRLIKQLVISGLWLLARLIIRKYQPKIVGVTGSVGKTSTKDAVAAVLSMAHQVRASTKSYNSDFGIPLTIIGAESPWHNPLGWLLVFSRGLKLWLGKNTYPAWLVLEVGADRPGDIKRVANKIKFDVAVLTHLPDLPVHVEFFPSTEAVVQEKLSLPKVVGEAGLVVLNADDEKQLAARGQFKSHLITYGLGEAMVRAEHISIIYGSEAPAWPEGLTFKLSYEGTTLPVRLPGVVGEHLLYPALAAAAVGLKFGVNLVQVAEALGNFTPPPGRMRLVPGLKDTLILDDTYNASPAALQAGLKTLGTLKVTGQKIVVIGDMLELGEQTIEAHKEAGRQAAAVAESIITVGIRSRFAAEGAKEQKFSLKKIHHCHDARQAGEYLQKIIKPGDLIYLKGSQRMRLEKAVEEIMREPQKKELLLCRQDKEWQKR